MSDRLLTLEEASAYLPGKPHVQTVGRWVRQGVRGVRLESLRAGHRVIVTEAALNRFMEAVAATYSAPPPSATPPPPKATHEPVCRVRPANPSRRVRELAAAEQLCRRFGL